MAMTGSVTMRMAVVVAMIAFVSVVAAHDASPPR